MNTRSHERPREEAADLNAIAVRSNVVAQRFELLDRGSLIGATHWIPHETSGGIQRIFYHTTVNEAYGGHGLASALVREALDRTAAEKIPVVAVCPYVKKWLAEHPEHPADRIDPRPEHFETLRTNTPTP